MHDFKITCEQAARAGGRVLLSWRGRFMARSKAPADLVTDADLASQDTIRDIVLRAFPEHDFLGEEDVVLPSPRSAGDARKSSIRAANGYRWLVDPLDGTTNYVHRLDYYSVSVALEHCGELLVAAVYDPVRDECFTAAAGQGAELNRTALSVSDTDSLDQALVAASFSAKVPRGSLEIQRFVEVLHRCQAVRRLGSAALNLCYVAAGRLDAYWATTVKTWDVAAGILLVREAGGHVTAVDGGPLDLYHPQMVATATDGLRRELVSALTSAGDP